MELKLTVGSSVELPVRQLLLGIPRLKLCKSHVIMSKTYIHLVQVSKINYLGFL